MPNDSPSGWCHRPLGSLADYINGFGFSPDQWSESGLPIVRIENMRDPGAIANFYDGTLPDRFKVVSGDLLLSWSATLMALIWDRPPAWVNQHIFKVVPRSSVDRSYLHHLLAAALEQLAGKSHGTTMKHVKRSDLLPFEVWVAPDSEQRRIGEVLDTIDDVIRSTEQLITKLEQMKQGLLHDLLTRGIDDNGNLRDPAVRRDLFVHSPIGTIPATWKILSCEDATSAPIGYGIVQAGPYVPDGVFVLMIRDLDSDFRTGLHRTSPSIDAAYARSRVRPGDVLLSVKATIGRVAVVPDWYEGNISRDMARLRPGPMCRPGFLRLLLSSELGRRILQQTIVGTTRAEVSIGVLRRVLIPLPPLDEQDRIVDASETIESQIDAAMAELSKLRLLKAGLTDDLLTGRVRVTVDGEAAA